MMTNYFYLNQEENNAQRNEVYSFREISISVQKVWYPTETKKFQKNGYFEIKTLKVSSKPKSLLIGA